MDAVRRWTLTTTAFVIVAVVHGLLTWPLQDVAVLYLGGMALAFVGEALVVRQGLLEHAIRPQVAGVPIVVLVAWPATVYVFYRLALLAVPAGIQAAGVAAVIATLSDPFTDPSGVRDGVWSYPEHPLSSPRFRGVPWWNFAGWLVLVFVTAMLPVSIV